jgi:predicted polyphosphate/ATP-dependent NAD kinase
MLQASKQVYEDADEERAQEEIARFIGELMQPGSTYILGPGTTTRHIAERQGVEKTLLGFDAIRDGRLIGADLNEEAILSLTPPGGRIWLIISPIGAQGFVLGRGTQQISPDVVRRIGIQHIIVVATPQKLSQTPMLFIDTGDTGLDREFGDSLSVVSGYRIAQRKRLLHPEIS